MKVFQIFRGFCHWDCTPLFATEAEARQTYTDPKLEFVEAPDYVFESWGFDETQEGDARFIRPTPPEGWLYDERTGTFYMEGWFYDEEHQCWVDPDHPYVPEEESMTESEWIASILEEVQNE